MVSMKVRALQLTSVKRLSTLVTPIFQWKQYRGNAKGPSNNIFIFPSLIGPTLKPNLLRDIIERAPTALESKRVQQVSAWE